MSIVLVIALQETKFQAKHQLNVKGYNIVRQDRSSSSEAAKQVITRDEGKKRVKEFANSPHNSEDVQKLLNRVQHLRNYAQRADDETGIKINKIIADIKRSYVDIKRNHWE
ncbi:uncharacterized protein NPIL_311101 [Nephila pilipes]|nr:uncharacterized protein NPIL_407151 [Nephila pilipes]GFU03075.1 uncharacterized protein NPIL_311101 [Nephila pilipes]